MDQDTRPETLSLDELERRIRAGWGPDTCFTPEQWEPDRPEVAQCGTTALVVADLMGGELLEAPVYRNGEQIEYHYWTRLPSGQEVDFTRTQFDDDRVIGEPVVRERPPVLKPRFQAMYDALLACVLTPDELS